MPAGSQRLRVHEPPGTSSSETRCLYGSNLRASIALHPEGATSMPARIMVINDTQEILELFEDLLTDEGYEVVVYSFGIQDMEEVVRAAPDLIILDLLMGGEQAGWQMLQKLKMKRKTANIPVIVCTAAAKVVQEMEGYLKSKKV